jgi:hypothetical protein
MYESIELAQTVLPQRREEGGFGLRVAVTTLMSALTTMLSQNWLLQLTEGRGIRYYCIHHENI